MRVRYWVLCHRSGQPTFEALSLSDWDFDRRYAEQRAKVWAEEAPRRTTLVVEEQIRLNSTVTVQRDAAC